MANWEWARNVMMPDNRGAKSVITNTWEQHLSRSIERRQKLLGGVDLSYPAPARNQPNNPVYTCIAGKVISAGSDSWNTVSINDSDGNRHEFLHMASVTVAVGQTVTAGTHIGFEGGTGPTLKGGKSNRAYGQHLHYQITLKNTGRRVDPVKWWNGERNPGDINDNPTTGDPAIDSDDNPITIPPDTTNFTRPIFVGTSEEFAPPKALPSKPSDCQLACWTNRVPEHEPWERVLMVDETVNGPTADYRKNVNHVPQIIGDGTEKTEKLIGTLEGDIEIPRNKFWRR